MTVTLLDKEEDLRKAGLTKKSARAILKVMADGDAQPLTRGEFVQEIRVMRQEMKAAFKEIDTRFDNMKLFIQVTVYGTGTALLAAIVAVAQLGWLG